MPPAVIEMKREFDQRKREQLKRYDVEKLRSLRKERKAGTSVQATSEDGDPEKGAVDQKQEDVREEGVETFVQRIRRSLTLSRSMPQ
jgi:hypothetical protein